MPSLHAAFSLLIAITVWPRKRKWLRPLVAAYPLLMAFSLIYAGEHYLSDILLGWAYTLVAVFAARALTRRWHAWRASSATPALSPDSAGAAGALAKAAEARRA